MDKDVAGACAVSLLSVLCAVQMLRLILLLMMVCFVLVLALVACGVGVHHAGLASEDRRAIEELFGRREITVIVSTSVRAFTDCVGFDGTWLILTLTLVLLDLRRRLPWA